jgi:intracellular septation protein
MTTDTTKPPAPGLGLAIDLGPLLVFFLSYWFVTDKDIFAATAIFMVATALAMLISRIKLGKISPMLLLSGVMVLGFGGLTLLFHDELFIKIKPTIYYTMAASILFFGIIFKRPTIQLVLGSAFPGLNARGWHLLARNWGCFFLVLALANELVWRNFSEGFWIGYKWWGAMPATILFTLANLPMLTRHGLMLDSSDDKAKLVEQTIDKG